MLTVYGLKVSYFTGKLEAYLRYKELPYDFHSLTGKEFSELLPAKTGALQMPAVQLDDGRWMTDTTPMIDWFESQYPEPAILPDDPVQAFVCYLIEDYSDEWQWRPAMHYRWSYEESSKLLARQIAGSMGRELSVPNWLIRRRVENRQRRNFVERDGVSQQTRSHVEQSYIRLLEFLRQVLKHRLFVFGDRPTLADVGLMGPLFRHYAMDPKPSIIMREDYSEVMAWVYRVWNARGSQTNGKLISGVPVEIAQFLREIAETHLEALCANAMAYAAGEKLHEQTIQGVRYRDVPVSQYRVWCLQRLQERRLKLPAKARETLDDLLDQNGALEPLIRLNNINSGYEVGEIDPFGRSIPVFESIS